MADLWLWSSACWPASVPKSPKGQASQVPYLLELESWPGKKQTSIHLMVWLKPPLNYIPKQSHWTNHLVWNKWWSTSLTFSSTWIWIQFLTNHQHNDKKWFRKLLRNQRDNPQQSWPFLSSRHAILKCYISKTGQAWQNFQLQNCKSIKQGLKFKDYFCYSFLVPEYQMESFQTSLDTKPLPRSRLSLWLYLNLWRREFLTNPLLIT